MTPAFATTGSTINWGSTKILKPDGTELASTYLTTGDQYIDTQTLPVDGTYTVLIQPDAAYTGSVGVCVYDVPPDAGGTIDVDGAATHVDLAVGQNATLTFDGIGGEQLQLTYPNGFGNNFGALVVKSPDGTELARTGLYQGSTISIPVLPTSGTYSVLVNPRGLGAGSIDLGLTSSGNPVNDVFHRGAPEPNLPFLSKPFSPQALVAVVNKLLARSA